MQKQSLRVITISSRGIDFYYEVQVLTFPNATLLTCRPAGTRSVGSWSPRIAKLLCLLCRANQPPGNWLSDTVQASQAKTSNFLPHRSVLPRSIPRPASPSSLPPLRPIRHLKQNSRCIAATLPFPPTPHKLFPSTCS